MTDPFSHSTYLVRRKVFKFFGGAFHVYGADGQLVLYSNMKAFKLKEQIGVFSDESMKERVLGIQARSILDFSSAYDVTDARTGEKIGALRRKGLKSMLKDEWTILDTQDRELGIISEDSAMLALIRRFIDAASLILPQKYHGTIGGQQVCTFKQNFNPFVSKITLDFSDDPDELLDRRLGVAAGILLCGIEGKQD